MRTFEERKSEIFYRAETKIRKRKKNIKIISIFSIPVMLTVLIISAITIKPYLSEKPENSFNITITDSAQIYEIDSFISKIYLKQELTENQENLKSKHYIISYISPNGETKKFTFLENYLISETDCKIFTLTQEEIKELELLLNIS